MRARIAAKSSKVNEFSDSEISRKLPVPVQVDDGEGVARSVEREKEKIVFSSPRADPRKCSPINGMKRNEQINAAAYSHKRLIVSSLSRYTAADIKQKTRAKKTLMRWCKFNGVGGVGIFVQVFVLHFFKTTMHRNYLAATALAVEAAVMHNFVWHERFTWSDRTDSSWRNAARRFIRFNLTTGAVSLLGNLALMRVLVGQGHMNYLLANAIAIVLCSLANFVVSEKWVFAAE
jgi:putative flippase GtrA